jgi:hypothetical protein
MFGGVTGTHPFSHQQHPRDAARRMTRGCVRFRRDSAGDPFGAEISHHRPTIKVSVCAGQTAFFRVDQAQPSPLAVFELYYDI